MVHLSGLLLLAAALTVFAERHRQQVQERADSKLRATIAFRVQDAGRFKLSRSHVNDLCAAAVVEQCVQLAVPPEGGRARTNRLAEVLAAKESEVLAMLEALGMEVKDGFSCHDFCEASAVHIPSILRTAAPSGPDKGCIDDACSLPPADVSHDTLVQEGLSYPPPPAPGQGDEIEQRSNMTDSSVLDPEVRGAMLFRAVLNIVFNIFPAVGEADDEIDDETPTDGQSSSLMQDFTEVNTQKPWDRVAFGPKTLRRRHEEYRKNVVTATAWIATALRNIDSGKSIVAKWLITPTSSWAFKDQLSESRQHLRMMLDGIQYLYVRKGQPDVCSVTKKKGEVVGGTLAYVHTYASCGVTDFRACGVDDASGRHIINICEFYWNRHHRPSMRAGTFVHEVSHHYGTDDVGYCDAVDCLELPRRKARNNADTYTKLVEELTTSSPGSGHAAPNWGRFKHCNTDCGATTFGDWNFRSLLRRDQCGQCKVVPRGVKSCGFMAKMVQGTFWKVCCHLHDCRGRR